MEDTKITIAENEQTQKNSSEKPIGINNDKIRKALEAIKQNKKIAIPVIVLILILLITIVGSFSKSNVDIPTFLVKKDKFLVSITESGEIIAKNSVSISTPRVRGNIKIVYLIPQGTIVKAGDTVVQFDPTEAISSVKDAEAKLELSLSNREKLLANHKAQVTSSESNLRSAELTFELSKLNLEQMKFEAEVKQQEAKLQHKKNELAFLKAKQDVESQKIVQRSELSNLDIEVQQRRSELERLKRDLEVLTLTAPTEGLVVYETNWGTGRKFALGDSPWGGSPILSLPDLSMMQSITYVNEVDVSKVRKGQKVIVKLDAFQDSSFTGTIASVASLGKVKDNNSSIKVFEITVDINSQSEILKPGMTTSNRIVINEISDVLFVPQEAVFEKVNKKYVFVKNGSSFDEREVEIGEKSENYVVIKKGLEAGEEVALRDPTIDIEEIGKGESNQKSVEMPS